MRVFVRTRVRVCTVLCYPIILRIRATDMQGSVVSEVSQERMGC